MRHCCGCGTSVNEGTGQWGIGWWEGPGQSDYFPAAGFLRALLRRFPRDLLSLPFRGVQAQDAASTELAIRAWARREERVRQVLDEVDAKRLSYVSQCFSALGFGIAEARARAFALYSYELSESLLSHQGTDEQKAERRAFMEKLLLTPS